MCLEDKVAIVTGASRGIGRAIALELARSGCAVAVNDVDLPDNRQAALELVELLQKSGVRAMAVMANVADSAAVEKMVEEVAAHFGRVDILVNNAGITRDNLLMRMKEADWDQVLDINLKGAFNCCKAVVKIMMKQRSGRIVNIASVVGLMGNPGQTNYAASKAGLIGFSKSLARETASRNITVNAVAPGFINTVMTRDLNEAAREAMLRQVPLGRMGEAEDVAKAVKFLVSDAAAYITGQTLAVDGGMVMN